MDLIVIEPNSDDNLHLLIELAIKLGTKVATLKKEDAEDLVLFALMQKEKTGINVSRKEIMDNLMS